MDQRQVDQNLAATRAALDEARFKTAWKLGEEMSAEEAIEYALTGETPSPPAEESR